MAKTHISWMDDVPAEQDMQKLGVKPKRTDIKLKDINWVKSKENRSRCVHIIEENKKEIRKSMLDGYAIPMIVVRLTSLGYIIVGGNHRAGAAASILTMDDIIPVYVIECTDNEFEVLSVWLNGHHGHGLTRAEKLNKALHWVTVLGMSTAQVAKSLGIPATTITAHIRVFERCTKMQIDPDENNNSTAILRIPEGHFELKGMVDAYKELLGARHVPMEVMEELIEKVKSKASESDKIAVIQSYAKRPARDITTIDRPRVNLVRAILSMAKLVEKAVAAKSEFATLEQEQRKEVAEAWESIVKNMPSFR